MKKLFLAILILGLVSVAGYGAYRGYVSWRQHQLVKQARVFSAKSDPKNALLCLQRALRAKPGDVEASRLMADLMEAGRSPSALLWRSRVVELNPQSLQDRIALAQTALTMRDLATATNALEGVAEADKKTASYHNVAGAATAAGNRFAEAEVHFFEAARLEPTNLVFRVNLAVLQLQATNDTKQAAARAVLNQLRANPVMHCRALRELAADALRYKQSDTALTLSRELVQQTNSVFRDRLLRLTVLKETKSPEFTSALTGFQREAGVDPGKVYELTMWQVANAAVPQALTWLQGLPLETRTNQPVALLTANCRTILKDWTGMLSTLDEQNWGELEFVRFAFRARALRGQNLDPAAKAEWERALMAAGTRRENLVMLLRLAAQWNWPTEGEGILWTIVNRYPGEKWAPRALSDVLMAEGRTRSLMMLYSQLVRTTPSDLAAKNNLAVTALLLNASEMRPHDLAREVYEKASTNAYYASTYAFSLHLQDKNAEALKIFGKLKPQELEDPALAAYYGMVLRANGQGAQAKKYLELAAKARLLPEERKLIDKAKAGM